MGADGICVEKETELQTALEKALVSKVPFVVDVIIDPNQTAPFGNRIQSLIKQGAKEIKGELSS
jgi:acetolactate synthase-1/2/3 large subunit